MKIKPILTLELLAALWLAGCAGQAPAGSTLDTLTQAPVDVTVGAASQAPAGMAGGDASEAAAVREVVETFGKRLQMVSLQSPQAAEGMQAQYADLVSPDLLAAWMSAPLEAPGRMVSSPWPERIEITSLARQGVDSYVVTGEVVEVTSAELVSGGAAARLPVRIVVQKIQGRWLISAYVAEQ